jgi:adenylate kinase
VILVLLGAPGAGKGTQAKILCAKYGFEHLATGDILRGEIAGKTELGLKAADLVKGGRLVDDATVTSMVAGRLEDGSKRYLLDGFPRNMAQAKSLAQMLEARGTTIAAVVYLRLPHEEALRRLSARRVCSNCGEVYNLLSKPPKTEGRCDVCGGELAQRNDDTEATAAKRLMVFEDLTSPLIAYYKTESAFYEGDASRDPDSVAAELSALIDKIMVGDAR